MSAFSIEVSSCVGAFDGGARDEGVVYSDRVHCDVEQGVLAAALDHPAWQARLPPCQAAQRGHRGAGRGEI